MKRVEYDKRPMELCYMPCSKVLLAFLPLEAHSISPSDLATRALSTITHHECVNEAPPYLKDFKPVGMIVTSRTDRTLAVDEYRYHRVEWYECDLSICVTKVSDAVCPLEVLNAFQELLGPDAHQVNRAQAVLSMIEATRSDSRPDIVEEMVRDIAQRGYEAVASGGSDPTITDLNTGLDVQPS